MPWRKNQATSDGQRVACALVPDGVPANCSSRAKHRQQKLNSLHRRAPLASGWLASSKPHRLAGEAGCREVIQALWPLNQHNLTSGIDAVAVDASAAIEK